MGDSDHTSSRAHAADLLEHDELKSATERLRIAWTETDATHHGKRAKAKIRDAAREWTMLAIATLVDVMRNGESEAARVAAAAQILDRGYGKPREHIDIDASTDQAAAIAAELAQLRKKPETARALLTLAEASAQLVDKKRD